MNESLIIARVLHILFGVFWAGTIMFNAIYLGPSLRDAGPDGAKVMGGLMKRRFVDVMPSVALVNVLSGLYLYWRASVGFQPSYLGSPVGMAYGLGMVAAIVGLLVGVGVIRPALLRIAALGPTLATAAPADTNAILGQMQGLRVRAGKAGDAVAWLLGLTVVTMAVARYL